MTKYPKITRARFIPLRWPEGQVRNLRQSEASFDGDRSLARSVIALLDEVRRIPLVNESSIVVTVNEPRRELDQGAAVYFTLAMKPRVLACDKWDYSPHNVWAIAKHVEALRAQSRWGVGTVEQAFAGYAGALPPSPDAKPYVEPEPPPKPATEPLPFDGRTTLRPGPWRGVLGFGPRQRVTFDEVEERFKVLARVHHPDLGGTDESMKILNQAREDALKALKVAS